MNKKHINMMISKLLEIAGDKFSDHGCNDLPENFYGDMTKEDIQQLYKAWHEWNGDDYNPDQTGYLRDDLLMDFFSDYILKEVG